ncbi:MAG: potassium channel family protein [Actinomycetota bacterium]|nr:potassium channel family protein [Actinomycetota bacterium]
MSRGRRVQAQGDPTAETQAALRAERAAGWLRVPLIVAALLAIPTIIVQESDLGGSWETLAAVLDWCIWAMFAANLAIMLSIVPDRRRWLIENPLDVLIVVFTPPFLPATMKLARVLPIIRLVWLVAVANRLRNVFSLQGLRYAALIVFTVVVGGGVIFVAVEPGQDLSTWDGLWWAAETVTTVAYGDIYPTTALGRIVATVVMTAGVGFVALLTGALAQRFLYGRSAGATPKPGPDEAEIVRKLDELSRQVAELQKALRERHG